LKKQELLIVSYFVDKSFFLYYYINMNRVHESETASIERELVLEKEISEPEILVKISESLNRIDQNLKAAHQSVKKIDKKLKRIDHNVTHTGIS